MPLDLTEFNRGVQTAREQFLAACVRATDQFGEHVVGDAAELAPVKTGALKASATTTPAVRVGESIDKEIGFNVDYAAAVHERLDLHHDQGQAKYLESALRENAPKFGPYIASKTKEAGF
jgi:hypothetical protein